MSEPQVPNISEGWLDDLPIRLLVACTGVVIGAGVGLFGLLIVPAAVLTGYGLAWAVSRRLTGQL